MIQLIEGDRFKTISGRITSPFPRTNYKREGMNQKNIRIWLKDEACKEAEYRNNDFNLLQFQNIDIKNFSTSDSESINLYVFDCVDGIIGHLKV